MPLIGSLRGLFWGALAAVGMATSPVRAADAAPAELRTEYAVAPLGLDTAMPRLAWRSPVARQSAYRIRVATSEADLERAPLWDSGKVASADNVQIAYAGPALASRQRYWWQVQVWDEGGNATGWSAPASWEMGLLGASDWQAKWISGPARRDHDWGDLTLDADLTLTGKSVDILFRALPNGKTYGDAYVWTLADDKNGPELIQTVRRYPGGTSSAIKMERLGQVKLPTSLKRRRIKLSIEAKGGRIVTRIDGVVVATIDNDAHAHGTIGFAGKESAAAIVHKVSVSGTQSPAVAFDFAGGDNPFTGGSVAKDGLIVASGVPGVDLVLPIEAPAPLVRRAFRLARPVASARLYYAGAGMPRLSVNGTIVGSSLGAGFTAYDKRVLGYVMDVTSLLRRGENVLGAELGRGWYGLTDPNEWYFHAAPWHAEPALKAQLEVTYADGTRETVATDGSWRTLSGPTLNDSVHRGERFDARLVPAGWDRAGFRDRKWSAVPVVTGPAGQLVAANSEAIEPVEDIAPITVKEVAPGVHVYDFGRIVAGWPVLKVSGPRGVTVSMVASERVADDGKVVPAAGLIDAQLQTDRYTLAGKGTEQWEPRFGYRGFRYVQIDGFPGTPPAGALTARIVHSAVARTGSFTSADPLLNQIDFAAIASILNNLHGFQTDTPTYEKNGWTGDAQASAGAAARSLDIARVWTKWLADFRDGQSDKGELPEIAPTTPFYGYENTPGWNVIWGPTTPWDAAAMILPWELYTTTGDTRILADNHDMQRRLVDYTATFIKAPDYQRSAGLSEWASAGGMDYSNARGGGIDAVTTAYFFHQADLLAKSSAIVGKPDDAARYAKLAEDIRAAYNARYWNGAMGWYRTIDSKGAVGRPMQVQNILPLVFGMVPEGREKDVARAIANDVEEQGLRTGVYGARYLLEILSDYGYADLAYRVATRTDEPSWGWWIANGHKTMFETWSLNSRSRDHHYFASISDWMRQRLAGLRPGAPGYKVVQVKPAIPDGLASAEAAMETVHGRAFSGWKVDAGRLTLTAEVPPNTTGEIWVPTRFGAVTPAAGASSIREDKGYSVYRTGPGRFIFTTGGKQ
ncbi:MAG: glycoside hydrolase family 78 protein [Proteobacteria bacterium]|nr:glycoside hydrolase family 78 protein [Pseudomonadota bacterium]